MENRLGLYIFMAVVAFGSGYWGNTDTGSCNKSLVLVGMILIGAVVYFLLLLGIDHGIHDELKLIVQMGVFSGKTGS